MKPLGKLHILKNVNMRYILYTYEVYTYILWSLSIAEISILSHLLYIFNVSLI